MVELSDGREKAVAIELQRVGRLDMNTTRVGTKLLLKGVEVKDGYLMMTPQNVVVEGGWVEEKDRFAEDRLMERLRAQLGKGTEKGRLRVGREERRRMLLRGETAATARTKTSTRCPGGRTRDAGCFLVDSSSGDNRTCSQCQQDPRLNGFSTSTTGYSNNASASDFDRTRKPHPKLRWQTSQPAVRHRDEEQRDAGGSYLAHR